jgi:hypothetical protein
MARTKNQSLGTRERQLMESESRWLQKALFALSKAKDDREKLAATVEDVAAIEVEIKGKTLDLSTVRRALEEAVVERAEQLREGLSRRHPVLR